MARMLCLAIADRVMLTLVTVSSKSFAISMHNVCITNEKTKAHSPANIMWSELGKKNCCSWYVFTIAEGQPFASHFNNSLISCFQRMHKKYKHHCVVLLRDRVWNFITTEYQSHDLFAIIFRSFWQTIPRSTPEGKIPW